ncbi:hypothetical protein [Streptomyces sp. 3211]|uniref:hypothetical protein n=1 Tax=Streptomyces sp. 3211 TaxID=1964449 RepID=UPI0017DAD15B|nr:hypothetical protein [Streptomyces sp. 3211]
MRTRTIVVIATSVGVAVAAATGVPYASAVQEPSAPIPATHPAKAILAAPPAGGGSAEETYNYGYRREGDGQIQINERTYSTQPGSCVAVVNVFNPVLGATTFNIRNESKKTIEFFNGITCDSGVPAATVGPRSANNAVPGLATGPVAGLPGIIVGSFRVLDH